MLNAAGSSAYAIASLPFIFRIESPLRLISVAM